MTEGTLVCGVGTVLYSYIDMDKVSMLYWLYYLY